MQFNTFVSSTQDVDRCVQAPQLNEVLLEPAALARQGRLSDADTQNLAKQAKQRGLRTVLVWDALMPERLLPAIEQRLQQWDLDAFDAVRVSDPGAAFYLQLHYPDKPLQLIVETGNHNLVALRTWCEMFSTTLERLILSIELTEETLVGYCQVLPVQCELSGVGSILLFYSPRSLLAPHLGGSDDEDSYLQATIAPEEQSHRQFPTLETQHGTFMFLDKDQFILHRLDALKQAGLHSVRIDLRHLSRDGDSAADIDRICQQALADPSSLREQWPRKTHAPFFKTNKTTVSFERIKSKLAHHRDEHCLAEIVAAENAQYLVFYTLRAFKRDQVRCILLPSGERLEISPGFQFRGLNGELSDSDTFDAEQLLVTGWMKKVVAGSLLLMED